MPDPDQFLPDPLRCPLTGRRLLLIERDGKPCAQAEEQGEDNGPIYPIVDGVPQLLPSAVLQSPPPEA